MGNSSVLVTGGTGFLGSHLVARLLAEGRDVTVVSRRPQPDLAARGVRVVVGGLDDPGVCAVATRGATTVFHVAARVGVWGRYEEFYRDNVVATKTLLASAAAAGVRHFVYTSTPSVVYNGHDLAGADETLPLTTSCPSPYPLTKALAERAVLAASRETFRTVALRPHLIWGVGDPHLVPRVLARARAGRLRVIGSGRNRVDMVHIQNATDAHLLAERALKSVPAGPGVVAGGGASGGAAGNAYFITNDEPVVLWAWINGLLTALGERPVARQVSLSAATAAGAVCEALWRILPLRGEPPLTRFIAAELAKDHWFSIAAARRDLGYAPRVSMAAGTADLVQHLRENRVS
ncbi:MAG TPA: NAD-dependent epimerase/dehydratase family protein [Opitutaceae bacterium]